MKHRDILNIIPEQFKGQELEAESSHLLSDKVAAQTLYLAAKKKLLSVNNWHKIAGAITARFQIIDQKGNEVNREVERRIAERGGRYKSIERIIWKRCRSV